TELNHNYTQDECLSCCEQSSLWYKNLMSWSRNGGIAWERRLFTTGQTLILSIVMIQLGFGGTHGGHVPSGVTAHGSPGGPLQFDRLEAALAARFHCGGSGIVGTILLIVLVLY